MIKIVLLFSLLVGCLSIVSAKGKKPYVPNCVLIEGDYLYASTTEVTNFYYQTFLDDIQMKEGFEEYQEMYPDTLCWNTKGSYTAPMVSYYFQHPSYRDYPVVGLTKHQMEKFCEWLSEILTARNKADQNSNVDSVLVRLPTHNEWMRAARGGLSMYNEYPWEGHDLRRKDKKHAGDYCANFSGSTYKTFDTKTISTLTYTSPVVSYWANGFGLYNCSGNVAEAIADKDVAVGGSWHSSGYDAKVTSSIPFEETSSKIGFRYFIEIKRYKQTKLKKLYELDAKYFKTNYVKVNDSIRVQKFEVDNKLYNLFLEETKYRVQDTLVWRNQFEYCDLYLINYRWHNRFANFPVVGITREDVLKYCDWLSKKYKTVKGQEAIFRLPTEKEWELAARGGLKNSPYPWGGPYCRNSKGILLANYRYLPESYTTKNIETRKMEYHPPKGTGMMFGADEDGFIGPAPVDHYYPNDYGVYNIAGNISEMIQETGYTKGGSWKSEEYFLQISSRETFEETPSSKVGFRLVMEIVN